MSIYNKRSFSEEIFTSLRNFEEDIIASADEIKIVRDTFAKAFNGDDNSQYSIGFWYQRGSIEKMLKQNWYKAIEWYKLSAKNNSYAQDSLGFVYHAGCGYIEKDISKAMYWYELASENGNASARYSLAGIYWEGKEITQNYEKAFTLYKSSAELGDRDSVAMVATMLERGEGVKKDATKAHRLRLVAGVIVGNDHSQFWRARSMGSNKLGKTIKSFLREYEMREENFSGFIEELISKAWNEN